MTCTNPPVTRRSRGKTAFRTCSRSSGRSIVTGTRTRTSRRGQAWPSLAAWSSSAQRAFPHRRTASRDQPSPGRARASRAGASPRTHSARLPSGRPARTDGWATASVRARKRGVTAITARPASPLAGREKPYHARDGNTRLDRILVGWRRWRHLPGLPAGPGAPRGLPSTPVPARFALDLLTGPDPRGQVLRAVEVLAACTGAEVSCWPRRAPTHGSSSRAPTPGCTTICCSPASGTRPGGRCGAMGCRCSPARLAAASRFHRPRLRRAARLPPPRHRRARRAARSTATAPPTASAWPWPCWSPTCSCTG